MVFLSGLVFAAFSFGHSLGQSSPVTASHRIFSLTDPVHRAWVRHWLLILVLVYWYSPAESAFWMIWTGTTGTTHGDIASYQIETDENISLLIILSSTRWYYVRSRDHSFPNNCRTLFTLSSAVCSLSVLSRTRPVVSAMRQRVRGGET